MERLHAKIGQAIPEGTGSKPGLGRVTLMSEGLWALNVKDRLPSLLGWCSQFVWVVCQGPRRIR
jgi:hypothetical protein